MTKRNTLETIANEIRTALFVSKNAAQAAELISKAKILVKDVRNVHARNMWVTTIEGWEVEAAFLG